MHDQINKLVADAFRTHAAPLPDYAKPKGDIGRGFGTRCAGGRTEVTPRHVATRTSPAPAATAPTRTGRRWSRCSREAGRSPRAFHGLTESSGIPVCVDL